MMQSLVMRHEALSLILQALSYSVISTIVYIAICYVIMWLREDILNVMDHVNVNEENDSQYYQKRVNKESPQVNTEGVILQDEDVLEERDYVGSIFDKQNPDNRYGLSLVVSNISKVFFSKS